MLRHGALKMMIFYAAKPLTPMTFASRTNFTLFSSALRTRMPAYFASTLRMHPTWPGVVDVLTAAELKDLGPLPFYSMVAGPDGSPVSTPQMCPLARDTVRYVGEPVAVGCCQFFGRRA